MKNQYFSTFFWIFKLQLKTSPAFFGWSIFNSIFQGVRPVAQTYVLAKLISSVSSAALTQANTEDVYFWLVSLFVIELIVMIVNNIDSLIGPRFAERLEIEINQRFITKMYMLNQEQFDDEVFNTKVERAKEGVIQLWRLLTELSSITSSSISFFISMFAIFIASPVVGAAILISIFPIARLGIKQNNMLEEAYKEIEPINRVVYRTRWMLIEPASMPEIRLMSAFKKLLATWRSHSLKAEDILYKTRKTIALYSVFTDAVQPLISFLANIYFFRLLIAGTIGLDRFLFLRGMLEQASGDALGVSMSAQRLHEISINIRNFREVYDTPPAIPNGNKVVEQPLTIEFKNVSFSYPGTDEQILDDLSFQLVPGSKLALVGENGAGKSTLIKLMMRQYLPTSGEILVNGIPIRDIEQESYYSAISNLSQDFLFIQHLPIRDNLTIGLKHAVGDKEIYKTTDLVDATKFIQKLPHNLSTRLDKSFDDGTNLSGGQKQRLGVARALLQNGDIIILDEPTSAIDAKAEYSIFNNIYKAHAGKTTLIVSHRFSTVRKADEIIVMDQGKIIEYGSHEDLIKFGGLYKEMFDVQAEGYK